MQAALAIERNTSLPASQFVHFLTLLFEQNGRLMKIALDGETVTISKVFTE